MYVILGASGHVGSAVLNALKTSDSHVIAVVHNEEHANALAEKNVEPIVVDVLDVPALNTVFKKGRRAFLLNPPAAPDTDTNAQELNTARAIANALIKSNLEKVVVASTYGAQKGDGIGDLSVLYEFERLVEDSGVPTAINRAAYYFSNLDMLLHPAQKGEIATPFPKDMRLPMVAPSDLGQAAAKRLMSSVEDTGIVYVEGPRTYSFSDVATAFSRKLGRPIEVKTTPCDDLEESFKALGFSSGAAHSYAKMTKATIDNPQVPNSPSRGSVTLDQYVATL